jgi:putative endonuclease
VNYVYLLRSLKDGKFYVGWPTDPRRHISEHNSSSVISTKSRTPFHLAYYKAYRRAQLEKLRECSLKRNPNMLRLLKKRLGLLPDSSRSGKEVVG